MFFLAMLFSIQFPNDDGSCDDKDDQKSCLKRVNFNSKSYCTWETKDGSCKFAAQTYDFQLLLLVAWLQLLLSAPVDAFIRCV